MRGTLKDRFDASYIPEPNSGCWLWEKSISKNGYGRLGVKRAVLFAHRISWMLHRGEIPKELFVLHKCDVRSCVNPEHLWLGTKADNAQDAVIKGRHFSPARLRTQCPRGHIYSGVSNIGRRICHTCKRDTQRKISERQKSQIKEQA